MSMENDAIIGVGAGLLIFFLIWKYGPNGPGGSGSGSGTTASTSPTDAGTSPVTGGTNPNSALSIDCSDPNADPVFCAMLKSSQDNMSPGA